jgi:hypothetical protein
MVKRETNTSFVSVSDDNTPELCGITCFPQV